MTQPTDLHDPELEDRLRALLHERAGTVAGPPPELSDQTPLARPVASPRPLTGSRRWAAVGIAAALLAAVAGGVALTRAEPADSVTTAAAELDAPIQAAPADTRVLVVNGSRWEGPEVLEMVRDELELRGFTDVTTELTTTELTTSVVYFRPGFENVATDVAMPTSLTDRQQPLPSDLTALPADVVVHLGADWNPLDSGEVRGHPSTLPYVPAVPSENLQVGGPWPGPGNETDPADTPVTAVRSFLTRVFGTDAAASATLDEVFQLPHDGYTTAQVTATFPGRSPFTVSLNRPQGAPGWTVGGSADSGLATFGPLPLPGTGEASYEVKIDLPAGTESARLWHVGDTGETMVVDLDQTTLDAGHQQWVAEHEDLVATGATLPGYDVDPESLGSVVLVKTSLPRGSAFAVAYFDDQGAPINVWMTLLP